MNLPCCFCLQPVDDAKPGAVIEVKGWARVRDQGGTNALRHRQPLGRVAHEDCLAIAMRGGDQGVMFT